MQKECSAIKVMELKKVSFYMYYQNHGTGIANLRQVSLKAKVMTKYYVTSWCSAVPLPVKETVTQLGDRQSGVAKNWLVIFLYAHRIQTFIHQAICYEPGQNCSTIWWFQHGSPLFYIVWLLYSFFFSHFFSWLNIFTRVLDVPWYLLFKTVQWLI